MNNFKKWIEKQPIDSLLSQIIAVNFNLYETDNDELFHAQLVACNFYDADDDDWACNPIYSSQEDIYEFEAEDWETALNIFKELVLSYLKENEEAPINKIATITVGFVDGDIELIKSNS